MQTELIVALALEPFNIETGPAVNSPPDFQVLLDNRMKLLETRLEVLYLRRMLMRKIANLYKDDTTEREFVTENLVPGPLTNSSVSLYSWSLPIRAAPTQPQCGRDAQPQQHSHKRTPGRMRLQYHDWPPESVSIPRHRDSDGGRHLNMPPLEGPSLPHSVSPYPVILVHKFNCGISPSCL